MRAHEFITEVSVRTRLKKHRPGQWFKGYRCTKDCSGHRAGYDWSKRKRVQGQQNCPIGTNNSFREGCLSWVYKR